jgi:hypothetical protein
MRQAKVGGTPEKGHIAASSSMQMLPRPRHWNFQYNGTCLMDWAAVEEQ